MKIVNQDLWLGMSSASNGAKSFACITLDFTIVLKQLLVSQHWQSYFTRLELMRARGLNEVATKSWQ